MSAIETCRTAALGGHVERCEDCAHQRIAYNSCRNRHCPKCQGAACKTMARRARRPGKLLPVPYYHVVFTLPASIGAIAFHNKPAVYDLLFRTAAETLIAIAADPKHLGARIGLTAGAAHLGSSLTHSSPRPRHRPRRRPVARRIALDRLQEKLLSAGARALSPVPPPLPREGLEALHAAGRQSFFGDLASLAEARLRRRPRTSASAANGWSTPRGRSPGQSPFSPISPATPIASRSQFPSDRPRRQGRHLQVEGLPDQTPRPAPKTIDARRRRVHPPLSPARPPSGFHRIRHMWTASWQVGFDSSDRFGRLRGHMSGLLVRYRTAGPDYSTVLVPITTASSWLVADRGVLGFRCDRVVHHVVALANLFETETSVLESLFVVRPSCKSSVRKASPV